MKKFIINCSVFSIIIILIHLFFAFIADESTSDYYAKVSSGQKKSLVLGTSRAFQALIPEKVDSVLGYENRQLFNFAFTIESSPFGKVYYHAIERKLLKKSHDGYFIVTISPWSISQERNSLSNVNDIQSVLYNLREVNSKPNMEYLFKKYPYGWGYILFKKIELSFLLSNIKRLNSNFNGSFSVVESNGWLNVYTSLDSSFVKKKEEKKFTVYKTISKEKVFSNIRYNYLIKTIDLLNKYGKVYLVRLPVHKKMLEIEKKYMPDFDSKIRTAKIKCDGFLDMNIANSQYVFTDGNHLHKSSSEKVSIRIGKWIKSLRIKR